MQGIRQWLAGAPPKNRNKFCKKEPAEFAILLWQHYCPRFPPFLVTQRQTTMGGSAFSKSRFFDDWRTAPCVQRPLVSGRICNNRSVTVVKGVKVGDADVYCS